MKQELSAFMDGAQEETVVEATLDALRAQPELQQAWNVYHLIGDELRGSPALSDDFSLRVMQRLAAEPTILAPKARRASATRRLVLPVAASLMGVAAVGWVAQALNSTAPVPVVAGVKLQAASPAVVPRLPEQAPQQSAALEALAAQHGLPLVREYLFVHDGYSPRSDIQGVGHYLRSVSDSGLSTQK